MADLTYAIADLHGAYDLLVAGIKAMEHRALTRASGSPETLSFAASGLGGGVSVLTRLWLPAAMVPMTPDDRGEDEGSGRRSGLKPPRKA